MEPGKQEHSAKDDFSTPEASTAGPSVQPPKFSTNFASLSLHQDDRIRLLEFPSEIRDIVRSTISRSWPGGVQAERIYNTSYEFKLHGNPWLGVGDEAMHARRLMQRAFASLWDAGWLLSFSTDIGKTQKDKDTLIFRHQTPPPPPCDWISVSFSRHDRIRFMDAPRDLLDAIVVPIQPYLQKPGRILRWREHGK